MALFSWLTEGLISEDEARRITQLYWEELTDVWRSAWEAWREMKESHRARLGETPCVPPVVLNGFAQSFARERFSGREDEGLVPCCAIPNVFAIYIKPSVLLRFNSLSSEFVVRNTAQTDLKEAYFRQEPIPGIANSATRLTVGYVANEAKTDIACVAISLQLHEDLAYHFLIDGTDEGTLSIPAPTVAPTPIKPTEQIRKAHPR